ncbi:MAG: sulfoxide reductase heme-binding subunit YedZ [Gammaproteobacteria bacterium]|nr:sulfoxide reductase heme-binding subunit YedZ [Gammaproteobacteria bacterium]MDH5629715.1 sulfoxide reductase heme-binding subunit YedZ [Gammaproteobacteria bacterium]
MFPIQLLPHILSLLPLAWLIFAIFNQMLGADPQEKLMSDLGFWGMTILFVSLSMRPFSILSRYLSAFRRISWLKFRRPFGLYSAFYLFIHFICYLLFILQFDWGELTNEIIERPYITVGFIGLIGMIPLVLTSTKSMQRIMGRKWQKLHKLVFIIMGLSLIHFIWQSKSDLNLATGYVIWALALVLIRLANSKIIKSAEGTFRT